MSLSLNIPILDVLAGLTVNAAVTKISTVAGKQPISSHVKGPINDAMASSNIVGSIFLLAFLMINSAIASFPHGTSLKVTPAFIEDMVGLMGLQLSTMLDASVVQKIKEVLWQGIVKPMCCYECYSLYAGMTINELRKKLNAETGTKKRVSDNKIPSRFGNYLFDCICVSAGVDAGNKQFIPVKACLQKGLKQCLQEDSRIKPGVLSKLLAQVHMDMSSKGGRYTYGVEKLGDYNAQALSLLSKKLVEQVVESTKKLVDKETKKGPAVRFTLD